MSGMSGTEAEAKREELGPGGLRLEPSSLELAGATFRQWPSRLGRQPRHFFIGFYTSAVSTAPSTIALTAVHHHLN